jgi:hypothetical protein
MSGDLVSNETYASTSSSSAQSVDANKSLKTTRKRRAAKKGTLDRPKTRLEKSKKIDVISGGDVQDNVKQIF